MGNISELERRISIRIILEDAEIIFALLSSEQDIRVSHKRNVSNTKSWYITYLLIMEEQLLHLPMWKKSLQNDFKQLNLEISVCARVWQIV